MISTKTHAVLDYLVGAVLLLSPWLFGFAVGGAVQWVPMVIGVAIIGMSLITDYEYSVAKIIPVRLHLGLDVVAGVVLLLSPWLFGFASIIRWPHVLFGLAEIIVPMITQRHIEHRPLPA